MLGLIIGIILISAAMIIFLRVGRTIRDMLVYSTDLSVSRSAMLPISIIKPVYGADDYTEGNFRSWAEQDYNGPVEMIFSFQDANDPALPIAKDTPGHPVVLVNPVKPGYSGKMSNLHFGPKSRPIRIRRHEWQLFNPSQVDTQKSCKVHFKVH